MSEPQLYATDYLRAQKDKQLHLIADMIDDMAKRLEMEPKEAYHKGLNDCEEEILSLRKELAKERFVSHQIVKHRDRILAEREKLYKIMYALREISDSYRPEHSNPAWLLEKMEYEIDEALKNHIRGNPK